MKRLWLALLLVLALLPAAALAEDTISYWDYDPADNSLKVQTRSARDCITYDMMNPNAQLPDTLYSDGDGDSGWYYLQGPEDESAIVITHYNNRITISGNVHLIVGNGVWLTLENGIYLPKGSSLTLYVEAADERTCFLNAYGYGGNAAIGGNANSGMDCGNLTINGVNVIADGAQYDENVGVGIGGGYNASGAGGNGGTITINGGEVHAKGGYHAAGIGGGSSNTGAGGNGGTITINGGVVQAYGGDRAAGIGGGSSANGQGGNGATVTIKGGTVYVYGGEGAAVFGGGYSEAGQHGAGGSFTIDGGTVTASINDGGVGFGNESTVTIKGGSVGIMPYFAADSVTAEAFGRNVTLNHIPKPSTDDEKVSAIRVRKTSGSDDNTTIAQWFYKAQATDVLKTDSGRFAAVGGDGKISFFFDAVARREKAAPTGVAAVAETLRYLNDGKITGVSAEMEYRAEGSETYIAITGTEVTGLAPGDYYVRYKDTEDTFPSDEVKVTVASGRAAYDTESTQSAKGITADNVGWEDEALLKQALSDYQSALKTFGDRFTAQEKQEALAELTRIEGALKVLERAAAVRDAIAALPDSVEPDDTETETRILAAKAALDALTAQEKALVSDALIAKLDDLCAMLTAYSIIGAVCDAIAALPDSVEPDDTETETRILAAKAALDALTAQEKALVSDALIAKLDDLCAMLTAYSIISGDGASITEGQNTALGFTANGPLSKLIAVLVDGQKLDATQYTAASGSTIITLAADYVRTLAAGEHTLTVRYTDGETNARFTVTVMPKDLPQTGDSSNVAIWLVLAAACACALGIILWKRKR